MRDNLNIRRGMFYAAAAGDQKATEYCRANGIALTRAASESNLASGGFLVPAEIGESLDATLNRYGTFRRFARPSRMAFASKTHPRRLGAATVYNPAENIEITETDIEFGSVGLNAKKIAALIRASSELVEDAEAFGAEVEDEFGRAMAQREDELGFRGTGTSADFGITGICTLLTDGSHAGGVTAASNHDTFAEIDLADLVLLISKVAPRALPGAAWYCSEVADAMVLCRLADAAGGIQVINNERHFLGRPIRTSPALPTSTGDLSGQAMILFGDLRMGSILGTRREPTIAASTMGKTFDTDGVLFRATERIDIVTADIGDETTPGAVVALIGA